MKISVHSAATAADLATAVNWSTASFASVHCNCRCDIGPLQAVPRGAVLHGATSCLGTMTQDGANGGMSLFVIEDAQGAYGTACRAFDGNAWTAARQATLDALADAGRPGEIPELIWVSATPGEEEAVLAGIQSLVGSEVPVIGGSAADNRVHGDWFVFDRGLSSTRGLVVSVLFPSRPVSFAYHNGYAPTAFRGTVTRAEDRTLMEIDGRPAFDVYSEWTGNAVAIDRHRPETQGILSESTLWPLGREFHRLGGVPNYLLAHPAAARATGEIDLFATVLEGEQVTLMTGTVKGLTERAGRVAALARAAGRMESDPIRGALMIYCGGCMMTVRDSLPEVVQGVNDALGGAPFLGAFTFGEQGAILGTGNRHGNLMISCIVFA